MFTFITLNLCILKRLCELDFTWIIWINNSVFLLLWHLMTINKLITLSLQLRLSRFWMKNRTITLYAPSDFAHTRINHRISTFYKFQYHLFLFHSYHFPTIMWQSTTWYDVNAKLCNVSFLIWGRTFTGNRSLILTLFVIVAN